MPPSAGRPVRVAHVINARGLGGAERLFAALVRRGRERGLAQRVLIPFATPGSAEFTAVVDPVPWASRACSRPQQVPGTWRWLRRELAGFDPDVVHVSLFHATVLTATIPRTAGKVRLVTNVYGPGLRVLRHPRLRQGLDRWAGRRFDRVAAISRSVEDFLITDYGYPAGNVVCIPLGWEGRPLPSTADDSRPTVVCVAKLRPEKGHAILLDAFAQVCRTIPHARLLLVGQGEIHDDILRQVDALDLAANVEITGPVEEVWPYLAQGHVFALASLSEAYGIAIVEAMAAGLPVVASAVGGIPELVTEGVTGELFRVGDRRALADHLIRLLQSPDLRHQMAAAAVAAAEPLTLERSVDRYLDLCEQLAGSTPAEFR